MARVVPTPSKPEETRNTQEAACIPQSSRHAQTFQQQHGTQLPKQSKQSHRACPEPGKSSRAAPSMAILVVSDSEEEVRRQSARSARPNTSFASQDANETSSSDDVDSDFAESDEEGSQSVPLTLKHTRSSRGLRKGFPNPDTMLGIPGMGKSYKRFRLRGIGALPRRSITR